MKNVVIYSTPVCHYCNLAKEFFKNNDITYTEYNVASDAQKRAEMVELTGQLGVPVIQIGDQVIVGFQEKLVSDILKAS